MKRFAIILAISVAAFIVLFPRGDTPHDRVTLMDLASLSILSEALERYASANGGKYPTNLEVLVAKGLMDSSVLVVPSVTKSSGKSCPYVYVPERCRTDDPPRVIVYPPIDAFRKYRPKRLIGVILSNGSAEMVECDDLARHLATGEPLVIDDHRPTSSPTPATAPTGSSSQSAPGANGEEWFVGIEEAIARPPLVRRLIRMDPLTGKTAVLMEQRDSSHMPNINLLDAHGRHLGVKSVTLVGEEQPRIVVDGAGKGEPVQVFRALRVPVYARIALSPDGRKLACVDLVSEPRQLVMENDGQLRAVPTSWWVQERPFSWNHDSTQVAFYYSNDLNDDDMHIQKHGLAILSAEGTLRSLIAPDEKTKTPESTAKWTPPGWGRSGRYVYYTAALAPDDPDQKDAAIPYVTSPTAAFRIEVATGKIEKLGLGEFCSVSPAEDYIITCPAPRPIEGGKRKCGTSKIDLRTKAVTYLPNGTFYPIISPSGRLAACEPGRDETVVFFDTHDWKPYGKPVQLNRDTPLIYGEAWTRGCRWIVPDSDKAP